MDEVCLFSHISQVGLIVLIPLTMILEGKTMYNYYLDNNMNVDLIGLILILLVNGIFYSIYNLMSFLVLSRTDLVTHAVFNVFRRVVIIIFTSYYFSLTLSLFNMLGIAVAVFGVLLFCYARSKEKKNLNSITK